MARLETVIYPEHRQCSSVHCYTYCTMRNRNPYQLSMILIVLTNENPMHCVSSRTGSVIQPGMSSSNENDWSSPHWRWSASIPEMSTRREARIVGDAYSRWGRVLRCSAASTDRVHVPSEFNVVYDFISK